MIDSRDKLINICIKNMQVKNCNSEVYKNRLKKELQEIDNQAEHEYFLVLHDKKAKFSNNENNLFIAYILGLCEDFDVNKEPNYVQGEFPDIDVDYLPIIQDYLRNDYCPRAFGRENVVNIGNYGTFGMKSALLDMARVHGTDRNEIQSITKNLQDKDEEGNPLTWEKALELSPELSEYSKKYPEVTDSARRLIDRNRSRGKHAGGTVISSVKIDDFVPVMTDTDGNPVSGWTEGLHDQDLQPVGLIKFDVLAIKDLLRIASCCKLIKERNNLQSISALEDSSDWSDISYLNDPKAIFLANEAKTRGVFQFDSEGMRNLVKSGGVDSFDDLVAYTALFRPSALKMQMHERYIERKKGREKWEDQVPECVREVLKKTHGILCYQEQCMQVLNIVGDIPLIHCEKIRKAISKKKVLEFAKYKQMFLENGSKKTGWPIDSNDNKNMNFLWNQLEAFSGYGFNKSHACAYTYTSSRLLYLKAHYPLEFFVSTLGLESDEDKLKSYKREAERLGIKINRCNLNKSKANFEIVDNEIYIGFSNIKGIGKEVAEEIVAKQPFSGIEDFLKRFGTDKRIIEPLVYLEVFKEKPINILLEFYEEYKKWDKSNATKIKAQEKRRNMLIDEMRELLKNHDILKHEKLMNLYENFDDFNDSNLLEEFTREDFHQVLRKYWKSVTSFEQKSELLEQNFISLENWESKNIYSIDQIPNQFDLEKKYYGFSWQHPLEKSPDYFGDLSFTRFKEDEMIYSSGVECMITKKPEEKISKNGNRYYYVLVEDEDWNVEVVTFWEEDYNRFKEELNHWNDEENRGNLLKIRVTKPGKGFKSYTFESPRKQERYKLPQDKTKDHRLQVMQSPTPRGEND
jgi:DNA polymerase III alpha subunit